MLKTVAKDLLIHYVHEYAFVFLNVILVTKQKKVLNTVQICTCIERSTKSPQQNEYMCSLFYSLCWVGQRLTLFFPLWLVVSVHGFLWK
jgi:hypothetical protein